MQFNPNLDFVNQDPFKFTKNNQKTLEKVSEDLNLHASEGMLKILTERLKPHSLPQLPLK